MRRVWFALCVLLALCNLVNAQNFVASPIVVQASLSRSSCTAPCAVIGDATSTTSALSSKPFHELTYVWNFGGITGSWAYGTAHAKDKTRGAVAIAVFDNPGTYVVSVVVFDATTLVIKIIGTVTVADPAVTFAGPLTTCVAQMTLPQQNVGGCPLNAAVAQDADWDHILLTYALTGQRVLLKTGDTFSSATATATIAQTGPGAINSYGGGAAPIIAYSGAANPLKPLITVAATMAGDPLCDWTIANLAFTANGHAVLIGAMAAGACRILWENITAFGTMFGGWSADAHAAPIDQIVIAGSNITNLVAAGGPCTYMSFLSGITNSGLVGSNFDGSTNCNQAVVRFQSWKNLVLDSVNIKNPPTGKNVLDIHEPSPIPGVSASVNPSRYGVVTDSVFDTGVGGPIFINPQNTMSPGAIQDVLLDSDTVIVSSVNASTGINIEAVNVTVRNTLIDLAGRPAGVTCYGISLPWADPDPMPNNIVIDNVSAIGTNCTNSGASGSALVNVVAAIGTVTIKNSLAYFPLGTVGVSNTGIYTTSNCPSSCMGFPAPTLAGNSTTAQILLPSPVNPWTGTPTGGTPTSFQLPMGSYGCASGVSVPNFFDFGRNRYPASNPNKGAWQAGSC